jgi:two-component system nitrogen regulation response regulator GlnG
VTERAAASVMVVGDEPGICRALERFFSARGDRARSFPRAEEALAAAALSSPDLVLLDVRLPGMGGIEALELFRALERPPAVVVITAHGTLDIAVEAVRRGAFDYLPKPLDLAAVAAAADRALASRSAGAPAPGGTDGGPLVGRSPAMHDLFKRIAAVALSDAPVLVLGESGSGKEMVARALHRASRRAGGPFEAVDCASLPETLFEGELFGHERGAFTGAVARRVGRLERAGGGTLFLDEVGEIPGASQAKLLRFLETRTFERLGGGGQVTVDARIVAATHRDLEARIREGLFRADLFYRLNVVTLRVPPLRERPDDVPLLVAGFLADPRGGPAQGIAPAALDRLVAHRWPGNVRELRNAVEHARVLSRGSLILPEHLPPSIAGGGPAGPPPGDEDAALRALVRRALAAEGEEGEGSGDLHARLVARIERPLLEEVLARTGGNQVRAARILGIHRTTLRERMDRYGIGKPTG